MLISFQGSVHVNAYFPFLFSRWRIVAYTEVKCFVMVNIRKCGVNN